MLSSIVLISSCTEEYQDASPFTLDQSYLESGTLTTTDEGRLFVIDSDAFKSLMNAQKDNQENINTILNAVDDHVNRLANNSESYKKIDGTRCRIKTHIYTPCHGLQRWNDFVEAFSKTIHCDEAGQYIAQMEDMWFPDYCKFKRDTRYAPNDLTGGKFFKTSVSILCQDWLGNCHTKAEIKVVAPNTGPYCNGCPGY